MRVELLSSVNMKWQLLIILVIVGVLIVGGIYLFYPNKMRQQSELIGKEKQKSIIEMGIADTIENPKTIDTEHITFIVPEIATHYWMPDESNDFYEAIINLTVKENKKSTLLKLTWNDERYIEDTFNISYTFRSGKLKEIDIIPYSVKENKLKFKNKDFKELKDNQWIDVDFDSGTGLSFTAIDDINVSACGTLSTYGETYNLNQSIQGTTSCIVINNDSITLNLKTFNITLTSSGSNIQLSGARSNVSIVATSNLAMLRNTGGGLCGTCRGVYSATSDNNTYLSNFTQAVARTSGQGINLVKSNNATFDNITFTGHTTVGNINYSTFKNINMTAIGALTFTTSSYNLFIDNFFNTSAITCGTGENNTIYRNSFNARTLNVNCPNSHFLNATGNINIGNANTLTITSGNNATIENNTIGAFNVKDSGLIINNVVNGSNVLIIGNYTNVTYNQLNASSIQVYGSYSHIVYNNYSGNSIIAFANISNLNISHNNFYNFTNGIGSVVATGHQYKDFTIINNYVLSSRTFANFLYVTTSNSSGWIVENNFVNYTGGSSIMIGSQNDMINLTVRNNTFSMKDTSDKIFSLTKVNSITIDSNREYNADYIQDTGSNSNVTIINEFMELGTSITSTVNRYSFVNTTNGRIDFTDTINTGAERFNLFGNSSSHVVIDYNYTFVNETLLTGFNKSANITLYNLQTTGTGTIKKDGVTCSSCYAFTPLTAGTVIFNVTDWSAYWIEFSSGGGDCWTIDGNIIYIPTGCVYSKNTGSS